MRISFWSIGKSHEPYIIQGVEEFSKRISHYFKVDWKLVSPPKISRQLNESELKRKEAEQVVTLMDKDDYLVAMDEGGKPMSSPKLAEFLQARANESVKNLVFLIGGAYGIDESLLKRAQFKWSLSELTFPHQLVRLILAEQIYRACTIMKNEKYHHGR